MIVGVILILTGAVALFIQAGVVDSTIWSLYWPVIMIGVGLSLVYRNEDSSCMMCHVMSGSETEEKKKTPVKPIVPEVKKEVIEVKKPRPIRPKVVKSKK